MSHKFEKSLQKLNVFFKFSGMNLYNKIESPLDTVKYRWLLALNFLWLLLALISVGWYIVIGISEGRNLTQLTSVAPCFVFSSLAVIKSFCHWSHEKDVQKLIESLKELERNENIETIEKENVVVEETRFLHAVLNVLFFVDCSMMIVFDMTPLIMIAVKYFKTGEFEMLLPYLDMFLFIPYKFKYWLVSYVHQIWSEVVALSTMGAADCLFFIYCTYIRVQFRLLQYDFENVIPRGVPSVYEDELIQFNKLVKRHQVLIESSNILEAIYSRSTLCNFLSSSLIICLTGFNITVVDDIAVAVTFITFLAMGLMQVFLLCLFADMMRSASEEVSNAVYNCRWYLRNSSFGKQVLLVKIRSDEPCKLTAAGFADVNLRAFMRVLSTAWSYFALLQTLYRR